MVSVYGSTEAEPIAHVDAAEVGEADWAAMRTGAGLLAGKPATCVQVRIVDDEILVAGDHVVGGYLDPAQDRLAKVRDAESVVWHRTGDSGRFDDQGRLWLLGRADGRVAGLWPFEVEAPARLWPGVRRAALAAIDGEAILAIEGDRGSRDLWTEAASALGIERIIELERIPLDRRHGSKVDRPALSRLIANHERRKRPPSK
jgi:olefin beta-lactone synthetase